SYEQCSPQNRCSIKVIDIEMLFSTFFLSLIRFLSNNLIKASIKTHFMFRIRPNGSFEGILPENDLKILMVVLLECGTINRYNKRCLCTSHQWELVRLVQFLLHFHMHSPILPSIKSAIKKFKFWNNLI